jgi:hypothetical protein
MLTRNLIAQQYKSFIRNGNWRRNLPGRIVAGIMKAMVILAFLMLGFSIREILKEIGGEAVATFNSFLLWYFAGDLVLRCFLQPLPTLQIIPLLRLPIRKKKLIDFLLFTSFWNLFSLIPFLVLIPFSLQLLYPLFGIVTVLKYLFGTFLLIVFNNYLAVLIGFLVKRNLAWFIIPIGIIAGLFLLQELQLPVGPVSIAAGRRLLEGNLFLSLPLLASILIVITLTRRILLTGFYTDEVATLREWKFTTRITGLDSFNQAGEIKRNVWLEINLLIRNKRPRQILGLAPFYLIYFIVILTDRKMGTGYYFMLLSFLLGFLPALYGQFVFSWESSFFDGIMARKGNFVRYVKAKYYLMCSMILISFIPFYIVLTLTSRIDTLLFLSLGIFTAGMTCFLIMLLGVYNDGRIDLGKSSLFNYQGVRASQFVLSLLFILLPFGLFELFKFFFNEAVGKLAIALPGLLFIIFHDWWIQKIVVPLFLSRKYKNLEGYRKLSI